MSGKEETATFGGGCFWCTQALFKRLKGVTSVVSGYSGGNRENPTYEQVVTGGTKHAESIQIMFDPYIISFEKLLEVFFATHDPTTKDRQGADVGTQYRSVIFYHDDKQKDTALNMKNKVEQKNRYDVVTEIVPFAKFYSAEDYHQNYYDTNQSVPYCMLVINPKVKKLLQEFGNNIKEEYK